MSAARALEHPLILPESLRGVNIEVKADRPITEEELLEFCAGNDHLRIEQDKNGKLIIMPPVDLEGGTREGIAMLIFLPGGFPTKKAAYSVLPPVSNCPTVLPAHPTAPGCPMSG